MFNSHLAEYKQGLIKAMEEIQEQDFQKIIALLQETYQNDRQVFVVGNGGSAGTANHFVCDFGKNAVQHPEKRRFRILSLCDNVEKITAFGNDVSFEEIFRQQMINLLHPKDLVIVISASGSSPNLVRACKYAREKGASIVALSGFGGGKIREYATAGIYTNLKSYEQIEDLHLIILHTIVCFFKSHPDLLNHATPTDQPLCV